MKKIVTITFLMFVFLVNAQVRITGRVVDENNKPLQKAAVYINNTSIGTSTSLKGYFDFYVDHGSYNLIVSYLGYETVQYYLNTLVVPKEIVFKLTPKTNTLNEIVVSNKKKISKKKRAYYMRLFKENFIGKTFLSEKTKIKNEYAIDFEFDEKTETLDVITSEPLVIENKGLGYLITYDLIHFQLEFHGVMYLGFTRYEELEASVKQKKEWEKQRVVSYNGSTRHFIKSILKRDTLSGFEVDHIRLIPNPDRPTDEEIIKAKKFIKKRGGLQRNPFGATSEDIQQLKLSQDIVRRSKLKRYIDITIKKDLTFDQYLNDEQLPYLFCENSLRIRYTKEYEESNYSSVYSGENYQMSKVSFYNDDKKAGLNRIGVFQNPLDVLLEGYWAFEKVADQLPLNYKLKN